MYKDPPMATLTRNDGMISLQHCQEWSFCDFLLELAPTCIYFFWTIKTSWKVSMCVAAKMCCIHIWTISSQMYPSFKYQQRHNSHARKTNWDEKTGLYPLTPRNQFVLWTKTTETMPAGAKMPTRWLHQENLQRDHMIFISGFIWVDTYFEIIF